MFRIVRNARGNIDDGGKSFTMSFFKTWKKKNPKYMKILLLMLRKKTIWEFLMEKGHSIKISFFLASDDKKNPQELYNASYSAA
jgi:hypothetical protein